MFIYVCLCRWISLTKMVFLYNVGHGKVYNYFWRENHYLPNYPYNPPPQTPQVRLKASRGVTTNINKLISQIKELIYVFLKSFWVCTFKLFLDILHSCHHSHTTSSASKCSLKNKLITIAGRIAYVDNTTSNLN